VIERGQVLAERYRLVQPVDTSADIQAWAADDLRLERRVRVEVAPAVRGATRDETFDQFWARARAAAQHSAVDGHRVLDAGTDASTGQPFLVREWPDHPPAAVDPTLRLAGPPAYRTPTVQQPSTRRGWRPGRWLVLGAALVVLVGAVSVTGAGLNAWLAWINEPIAQRRSPFNVAFSPSVQVPTSGASAGQATPTPVPPPATVAAAPRTAGAAAKPGAAAVTSTTVTPTPAAAGGRARIVNTDGQGVALRNAPGGDRLPAKGYDEGASVTVLERSGTWTHIRGDDGRDGWVLSVTVSP
jgi:hypothetical protein